MDRTPEFVEIGSKLLTGIALDMSRAQDRTPELWRSFMPRRHEIAHRASTDFLSLQVYPQGARQLADPNATFTKWAAVEVTDTKGTPDGMQNFHLDAGLYATFEHRGPATDLSTVLYIFTEWLPDSDFVFDDRPQFEVLPQDYSPTDPEARELFWIPVRPRTN